MTRKIVRGDAAEAISNLPPESIDLTVFSPPYDNIRDYHGGWRGDFSSLGAALFAATKPGGVCAVVIGDGTARFAKSMTSFKLAVDWNEKIGWRLFECCLYHRDGNPGAWWSRRFRVDHEFVLIFFKGEKPKTFDKSPLLVPCKHAGKTYSGTDRLTNGGFKKIEPKAVNAAKCRGTVWRYATSNTEGNRSNLAHPATFPDKLAEDLILCFSAAGDLVCDPMCGSGTTCVMAAKNGRDYFGVDISAEYCRLARARIETEAGQNNLSLAA